MLEVIVITVWEKDEAELTDGEREEICEAVEDYVEEMKDELPYKEKIEVRT